MKRTEWLQETRMLRFEEALDAWTERRLTQEEAAQMPGVCPRTFRRYVDRYEEAGIDGLVDRRLSEVSARRAPVDEVLRLEALYRDNYRGWSVAHFHERCRDRHAGERSYTWVKSWLHEAGLVSKGKSRECAGGSGADRRLAARLVRGPGAGVHADRVRGRRDVGAAGVGFFRRRRPRRTCGRPSQRLRRAERDALLGWPPATIR